MGQHRTPINPTFKPSAMSGSLPLVSCSATRQIPPARILAVALVVALCSLALLPVWAAAWRLWSVDPLRSIGALFPPLALLGTLAAWRRLGFTTTGTPWGLPVLVLAIAAASLFSAPMLLLFFFGERVRILHPGMALFAYGAGAALWFGGPQLLRRALAPLCLLLLIDPVPHLLNTLLDRPLQILSANTARAFAHGIGLQPTGQQLQMMFTPSFGMFIVPGCNGVRGAITFGYLALIFGYLRHLPARTLALFTAAAVLAGYLFNLLRLCILVLYYRAGVSFPSIVGPYTLIATREERDNTGALMFVFGDYHRAATPPQPPADLTFGIYLASEDHYVFLSKLTQGLAPASHGTLDARTRNGVPVHFLTSFYRDPAALTMDPEANCRDGSCEGNLATASGLGFLHPHLADLFVAPMTRRVPILLRRTWSPATSLPDSALSNQFQTSAQEFFANLNLKPLLDKSN